VQRFVALIQDQRGGFGRLKAFESGVVSDHRLGAISCKSGSSTKYHAHNAE
jgi:hypothetical protein